MRQSGISLEKYRVTQSGYFRLATTVELGMGITDGNLLHCHGVAEGNKDKKISTLEYNNRTVYDCINNPFTADCGIPTALLDRSEERRVVIIKINDLLNYGKCKAGLLKSDVKELFKQS